MLTKRELYKAYYEGDKDQVIRKELLRYGKIIMDDSNEDDQGHWREYTIEHEGMIWNLILNNGDIDCLHWSYSY